MRIGIDARELCGRPTGVGRYLDGLLHEWAGAARAREHEFVLYAPETLSVQLDGRRFPTRVVGGSHGVWWEQVRMPAVAGRDHLDVFFSPGYTAPLFRRVPTIVAIHDVSFAARPDWFRAGEGIRRRWLSRLSAHRSLTVVTISEFSRRELVDHLGLAESRIQVIPPGITPPLVPADAAHGSPTVLFVGSIFNRRHLPHLVRAFAPLARRQPDARLEIVGDNRTFPHQDLVETIRLKGLSEQARWRPWVPDEELGRLYGEARAFAFLSEYEGLGLTPLEAMTAGVPPLLLDTPVAHESCGDAALYASLGDLAGTTAALETLLFDAAARTTLLEASPAVLSRFRWPRAASDTLTAIERAVSAR